jgi:hypothetical protein
MSRNRLRTGAAGAVIFGLLISGPAATQSTASAPVATYWMTAHTEVGMPAMGPGGTNPMAMMSAMSGPQGPRHNLILQLGSSQEATGAPRADHFPPAGLQAGDRLPLATGERTQAVPDDGAFEAMPTGAPRMLIYFGCGETARQPVSIRLDQAGGRQFAALINAHRAQRSSPPSVNTSRNCGEWPNTRARQRPPSGSLVGEHVVRGTYAPDIRFTLDESQDFLAPLQLTGVGQSGPVNLGWNAVPNAKGYLAYTMGQNEAGDMVIWSSSDVAAFPMYLPELLTPADLTRLQSTRYILPAGATNCRIPTAVTTAAPDSMLRVIAFGGETNIAWPPRPADRNQPWKPEYVVKVRYNSTAGAVLGMEMDEAGDEDGAIPNPLDALPIPGAARALGSALGRFRRQ